MIFAKLRPVQRPSSTHACVCVWRMSGEQIVLNTNLMYISSLPGCIEQVARIAEDHLVVIGAVVLGICAIQLLGTVISCALQCRLRKAFV